MSAVATADKWILTGCYDNSVNLWTVKGTHKLSIPGHTAPVKSVSWISLSDTVGVFVSASHDQTAMIWEWTIATNTVECVFTCKGHERGIISSAVNGAGQLMATGSWDTMLKVWSACMHDENDEAAANSSKRARSDRGRTRTPMLTLPGHREAVSAVQWMSDDTLLTGSWDHTMKIWDLSLEGVKSEISGNKSFFDVSYSKLNGLIVTCSADKSLRLYDARSNRKYTSVLFYLHL